MTREEAINMLTLFKENPTLVNDIDTVEEATWLEEALDMAIKTIEQQPCEDCISREEALEEACEFVEIGYNGKGIFRRLKELPSVTPQRPKGKWILIHPLQEDDDEAYICSNCEHGDWDCDTSYKYCPFCGADMRESEE